MGRTEKPANHLVHCGRVITAEELADICETVAICSRLSRKELALTISEHLDWRSASGSLKQDACVKLLDKLESQGLVTLPAKQVSHSVALRQPLFTNRTVPCDLLAGVVGDLGAVRVVPVTEKDEINLWNEYVSRYHYLGYSNPFGCSQRYFITSADGRLGCLLFSGAAKGLGKRDHWIGWSKDERLRNLGFVVNNSRFLGCNHRGVPS